jgi:hypothetical protein
MKHFIIIIVTLTIVSSVAFAAVWFNDPKIAPTIPLSDAYRQAMIALGSDTNTFHCTAAQFEAPGFWSFRFYNTDGILKTVWAYTDHAQVIDGEPPH